MSDTRPTTTTAATTTTTTTVRSRGSVRIDTEVCKGCELCITACPPEVLSMSTEVNHLGYRFPQLHPGCTGCAGPTGTDRWRGSTARRNEIMAARKISRGGPSSLAIRMYNVGFGDCFLLTFHYATQDRFMLIDYGSTAAPKNTRGKYMTAVAKDIQKQCQGKLDVLVVTHRHRDHISGFATTGEATGKIIASLRPDYVIQPWTEDPRAKTNATTATVSSYTKGRPDLQNLTAHFLGSLEDMHRVAGMVAQRVKDDSQFARSDA